MIFDNSETITTDRPSAVHRSGLVRVGSLFGGLMSVESVRGLETLAQQAMDGCIFRVFELSCFRDPPGDFVFREFNMKTNHENTKVRKHEKEKGKLDRSCANSGELARSRVNFFTMKIGQMIAESL